MRLIPVAVVLTSLSACGPQLSVVVPAAPHACATMRGEAGITARLYFGRTIKGGGVVDEAAWKRFLAEQVTPRFPSGFTVFDGYGQWRQRATGRIIQEPSTVIEIAAGKDIDTIWKFEEVRADYRTAFNQESVGLVISENCMSF